MWYINVMFLSEIYTVDMSVILHVLMKVIARVHNIRVVPTLIRNYYEILVVV